MSSSLWSVLEEKIKWWPVTHSVPSRYACPLRRRETLSIFGDLIYSTNSITAKKFAPIETKEDCRKSADLHFSHFSCSPTHLQTLLGNLASPDSRNSCGWYPLKMDQITRASPAELRTIVRAIWRSIGYTTICASNRYIFDQIKKNPPFWYSGRWIDETRTYINDYLI